MSSIPLVALMGNSSTHPTPFIPPVELQRQRMDMLAQQQQMEQSAQLQPSRVAVAQQTAQQGALDLADRQAITQAMKQWDGKDINDLPGLVLKANGSANAVLGLKSNIVKYQTDLAKMTADQLTNEATKNDAIAGHIDAIKGLDPAQKPQAFEAAKADLVKNNYMTPQEAQSTAYPGPDGLDNLEKMYVSHSAQVANALKASETQTNTAEA